MDVAHLETPPDILLQRNCGRTRLPPRLFAERIRALDHHPMETTISPPCETAIEPEQQKKSAPQHET